VTFHALSNVLSCVITGICFVTLFMVGSVVCAIKCYEQTIIGQ